MASIYPPIGIQLTKKKFSEEQLQALKKKLPTKLILRIYGLAGVGKGTLSQSLSETLDIPNLESSFILRSVTLVYEKLKLVPSRTNTDKVFNLIKIGMEDDQKHLRFEFEGQQLSRSQLKSSVVDTAIPKYSSDPYVREKYYQAINYVLNNVVTGPVVLDGRGANTPYLRQANEDGFTIIRILLDSNDQVNAQRYYSNYLKNQKLKNPGYQESDAEKKQVLAEFEQSILLRNQKDAAMIKSMGIGLISEDSGYMDTSDMSPQDMLESALDFIDRSI